MSSKTEIWNMALANFGGGSITNTTDTTETARLLNTKYDNCVRTVLRDFPWAFARSIKQLTAVTITLPNYNYVYTYPTDCEKILRVCDEGDLEIMPYRNEYKLFTDGNLQYIASNIENAYIEYTMYVTTTTLYDSAFTKALSYLLASEVAQSATGNNDLSNMMLQKYQLSIAQAKLNSASEDNIPFEFPDSFTRGRR